MPRCKACWDHSGASPRLFPSGARGASPYDVAKLLGDTVATVEKHYAPFVKELRHRARRIMDNGEGIEKTHCTNFAQSESLKGKIQ
jgi:hypothetical protein